MRKLLLAALLSLATIAHAATDYIFTNATTTTTTSSCAQSVGGKMSVQAKGNTGSGSGAATVIVVGSNDDGATWVTLGTITLTLGVTAVADGFAVDSPWGAVCGYVSAISGTGATVSLMARR